MSSGPQSVRRAYAATLAAAVLVSLVYALQSWYPDQIGVVSALLTLVFAFLAVLSAYLSFRKYGGASAGRFAPVWMGFALGISLWFLGEVSWDVYSLAFGVAIPYPSYADVFYLGGYIPLIVGIAQYVRIFRGALTRERIAAVGALILFVGFVISFFMLLPVLTENASMLTRFFGFAYPFLDLVMLSLVILGLGVFVGGTVAKSWALFLAGVVLEVVGDVLFTYQTSTGTYYGGSPDDLFFVLAYMTLALAFFAHSKEL